MRTPWNRYLLSCSLLVMILGFLVGSDYAQAKPLVDQHQISHSGSEYALTPLTSNLQVDEIPSEEWNSYESVTGGYSFQYPSAYFVAEGEKGFIQLRRSRDGSDQELITLMYLDYEIEETDDLLEWAKLYDIHHKEGMFELAFSPSDLEKAEYPEGSRQIAISSTLASPLAMHAFLITNGRLVLRVSAYSSDQDKQQTLREVAQSVTFSSDAPLTFSQLYAPDPPPYFTTLSEFLSYMHENDRVRTALDVRSNTGQTPIDLLAEMSERARSSYERTLEANAALLGELDRQRALPPSTGEAYSESDYQSYLESEREYNKTLLEEVPSLAPKDREPRSESLSPFFTRQVTGVLANCSGVVPTSGLDNRRGLPARFTTPIRTYNPAPAVACGSSYHTNEDTYSADIGVGIGTEVYATTQNETVYDRRTTDPGSGYGKYVRTYSMQYTNGKWHMATILQSLCASRSGKCAGQQCARPVQPDWTIRGDRRCTSSFAFHYIHRLLWDL